MPEAFKNSGSFFLEQIITFIQDPGRWTYSTKSGESVGIEPNQPVPIFESAEVGPTMMKVLSLGHRFSDASAQSHAVRKANANGNVTWCKDGGSKHCDVSMHCDNELHGWFLPRTHQDRLGRSTCT